MLPFLEKKLDSKAVGGSASRMQSEAEGSAVREKGLFLSVLCDAFNFSAYRYISVS